MSEQTENQNDLSEAINLLEGMLERMNIEAQVEGEEAKDKLLLRIECDAEEQTQRIIGRRGQVVDAFQHLLNKMLSRDREERGKPVIVDAGGYRERHVERLEGLAERSAEKARESGEAVDLNPMSAYDRRIVHMRLAELDGVTTQSEGEGDSRHIVVFPE
ncbi:MAG: KH domain-containing protein [Myxococcales bacterium]|nr:KH domain-containing protein [Myxococcales bacterium]